MARGLLFACLVLLALLPWAGAPTGSAAGFVGTIEFPQGSLPYDMTVDVVGGAAYVAEMGGERMDVVNTATRLVEQVIPLGTNPATTAETPDRSYLYVGVADAPLVRIMSVAANEFVDSLGAAIPGGLLAFTSDGSRLFVSAPEQPIIDVYDPATQSLLGRVDIGPVPGSVSPPADAPHGAAAIGVSPDNTKLYVVGQDGPGDEHRYVYVVDTSTLSVTGTITVEGRGEGDLAFSPDGTKMFVVSGNSTLMRVISLATGEPDPAFPEGIPLPFEPQLVALNGDGTRAYVAGPSGPTLAIVDTTTGSLITQASLPKAEEPCAITYIPSRNEVWLLFAAQSYIQVDETTWQLDGNGRIVIVDVSGL